MDVGGIAQESPRDRSLSQKISRCNFPFLASLFHALKQDRRQTDLLGYDGAPQMVPDFQHTLVIMVIGHQFYCELQGGIFFSNPPLTVVHKPEAK